MFFLQLATENLRKSPIQVKVEGRASIPIATTASIILAFNLSLGGRAVVLSSCSISTSQKLESLGVLFSGVGRASKDAAQRGRRAFKTYMVKEWKRKRKPQ